MSVFIGFLTFILVMNCLFLMLLVLIQLPKKEAGAGLAFGGAATDALFGAGSGNALTKMTKYTASTFVGLALVIGFLMTSQNRSSSESLDQQLRERAASTPPPTQTPAVSPIVPAESPAPQVEAPATTGSEPSSLLTLPPSQSDNATSAAPTIAPDSTTPAEPTPGDATPAPADTTAPTTDPSAPAPQP